MPDTTEKEFLNQYLQNLQASTAHAMFEEGEDYPAFTNDVPGTAAERHRYTV
jgi:hypothetical protein